MNYINKIWYVTGIIICFAATPSDGRTEEDNPLAAAIANPDEADRCVELIRIDHTHIVDNGFILFYMQNKKIYLNVLPRSCPGLKSAGTFMYRVPIMRLCNVDLITVLNHIGGEFYPGASCGLGLFYPIDKETAQELKNRSH